MVEGANGRRRRAIRSGGVGGGITIVSGGGRVGSGRGTRGLRRRRIPPPTSFL